MKIIFGLSLLFLVLSIEARYYQDCPTSKKDCPYPYNWDPVCSTLSCTYSNIKHMKCAGGNFWYAGECLGTRGEVGQYQAAEDK